MAEEKRTKAMRDYNRESNEFSKRCIKDAMIKLAKDRNYYDISVSELCRIAGVSRMTFYRNYKVINDVFFEIAYDLNNEVIEAAGSPFRMTTTRDWYVKVFEIIRKNRDSMLLMFQENFQYQWMKIVNHFAIHDPRFTHEQKYLRLIWSGGFENAVFYWLNNGLVETPEEMADYCYTYLPHIQKDQRVQADGNELRKSVFSVNSDQ